MFYNNFTGRADCPQKLKKGIDYIQKNYERSDLSLGDISSFLRMRRESVCRNISQLFSKRGRVAHQENIEKEIREKLIYWNKYQYFGRDFN